MFTGTARRLVVAAAALALIGTVVTVTPARAAVALVVTSSADAVADPADCTGSATCTLRDAITITDLAGGANTITFAPAVTDPIVLSQGALTVSGQALTLTGNGPAITVIDGNNASVVFSVAAGATLHLGEATVQHGASVNAGGIDNRGTTVVTDSVIADNAGALDPTCWDGPCNSGGGGIYSAGSLTLVRTAISANSDPSGDGGGVLTASGGSLTVTGSLFSDNTANFAAGLDIGSGTAATITASSFTGNAAAAWAGGLWNAGATTVANSTFSDNHSGGNNDFGWGAGILQIGGSLALTNTTVAGNSAANWAGGIGIWASLTVQITNSIVADNQPENCRTNGGGVPVASGGDNIENANTCYFTAASDHPDTPTGLQGALTDNGGPFPTLAPLPGSAARNAGDNARCAASDGAGGVDERGVPRPQGTTCTIGAIEVDQPSVAISFNPASPTGIQPVAVTVAVTPSTVTAGIPQGSVTLMDGATVVGSAAVDSTGTATFTLPAQPLGTSMFTASYTATNGFFDATAATTLAVTSSVTTTLAAAPSSIVAGDPVTFTAVFTPADASGSCHRNPSARRHSSTGAPGWAAPPWTPGPPSSPRRRWAPGHTRSG